MTNDAPVQPPRKPTRSLRWVLVIPIGAFVFLSVLTVGGIVWHQLTQSVPALVEKLNDDDADVRRQAASDLGDLGPDAVAAIPALVERLGDDARVVRSEAESALRRIDKQWYTRPEGERGIPHLIERLADRGVHGVREDVAKALAQFGPRAKDAVPALVASLQDNTPPVPSQLAAAYALGEIGPSAEAAIPPLVERVTKDPEFDVRNAAGKALGKIGHASLPALQNCLQHDSWVVRMVALDAFGFMDDPPPPITVVPLFIERLSDPEEYVRESARGQLAAFGPDAIPALLEELQNGGPISRQLALSALVALAPSSTEVTLPVLFDRLREQDEALYRPATLGIDTFDPDWFTQPTATLMLPALIRTLEDEDVITRNRAAERLAELGPAAKVALPALRRQAELEQDEYWKIDYMEAIRAIENPPENDR